MPSLLVSGPVGLKSARPAFCADPRKSLSRCPLDPGESAPKTGLLYMRADLPDLLSAHRAAAQATHFLGSFDELHVGYKDRLSCTGWGGLCFRVGFFVGMVGVGWSFRGTKAAVGSGG